MSAVTTESGSDEVFIISAGPGASGLSFTSYRIQVEEAKYIFDVWIFSVRMFSVPLLFLVFVYLDICIQPFCGWLRLPRKPICGSHFVATATTVNQNFNDSHGLKNAVLTTIAVSLSESPFSCTRHPAIQYWGANPHLFALTWFSIRHVCMTLDSFSVIES